jgi:hypothetical protein
MATLQDELTKKVRAKIIELFGPESALAQAMEDENFMDKLADLVAYIYGLVILNQPRPEPKHHPIVTHHKSWGKKWEKSITSGSFTHDVWSAIGKYWG